MNYSKRYISDIIEGEINNMSDKEIDRDIRRFERINKKLGVKDAVCITDGEKSRLQRKRDTVYCRNAHRSDLCICKRGRCRQANNGFIL